MNKFINFKCNHCNHDLKPVNDFGKMPLANGFIFEKNFKDEYFFNLKTAFCENCKLFQLVDQPKPQLMFNSEYPFYSSLSEGMRRHFSSLFKTLKNNHLNNINNSFTIEIGCNDGIFLENFQKNNLRHLGIEPSKNVANLSKKKSINVLNNFFDIDLTNKIIKQYGKVHLVFAANVICHIKDINSLFECVEKLLDKKGLFVFEDPYLGDVIENNQFDQIYDEHVYLFSIMSIQNISKYYNLELINCEKLTTHGGSMRYTLAKKGEFEVKENVDNLLFKEKEIGLDKIEVFKKFDVNCNKFKQNFLNLLNDLKNKNKKIIGYAATSKSTTILNYCNINNELINSIVDSTVDKQSKFSPGAHIPIIPDTRFNSIESDYCVLFAYNHQKEILSKEKKYELNGSKWIQLFPQPKIVND